MSRDASVNHLIQAKLADQIYFSHKPPEVSELLRLYQKICDRQSKINYLTDLMEHVAVRERQNQMASLREEFDSNGTTYEWNNLTQRWEKVDDTASPERFYFHSMFSSPLMKPSAPPNTPVTPRRPITRSKPIVPVILLTPNTSSTLSSPSIPVTPVSRGTPVTPVSRSTPSTPRTPLTPVTPPNRQKLKVKTAEVPAFCVFCQNNGEPEEVYRSHPVRDKFNRTTCARLRKYVCPICGATGDQAHTVKYCPEKPILTMEDVERFTHAKRNRN